MILLFNLCWAALYGWHCHRSNQAFNAMRDAAQKAIDLAKETITENERLRSQLHSEGEEWKETE